MLCQSIAFRHALGWTLKPCPGLRGLEQICRRRLADLRLSCGHLDCNKFVSSDTAPTTAVCDVAIKNCLLTYSLSLSLTVFLAPTSAVASRRVSVEAPALMCWMSHKGQWPVSGGCARVVSHAWGRANKWRQRSASLAAPLTLSSFHDMQPENRLVNTLIPGLFDVLHTG